MAPRNLFRFTLVIIFLVTGVTEKTASALSYDDVATIFKQHCVICHNGAAAPKGLRLDSLENIRKGSQSGPVAIPGDAQSSELVKRIRGDSLPRMPLTGPPFLPDKDIEIISQWIEAGMKKGSSLLKTVDIKVAAPPGPDDIIRYDHVAPIFAQRCVKCHRRNASGGGPPEGLSLQSYEDIIRGGDRAVLIPGLPAASEVDRRIRGISAPRMPFDGPPWLDSDQIDLITRWIQQGARDAEGRPASVPEGQAIRLQGRLTARWALDGLPLVVDNRTRIKKSPRIGSFVEVRGFIDRDGRVRATRIRRR